MQDPAEEAGLQAGPAFLMSGSSSRAVPPSPAGGVVKVRGGRQAGRQARAAGRQSSGGGSGNLTADALAAADPKKAKRIQANREVRGCCFFKRC